MSAEPPTKDLAYQLLDERFAKVHLAALQLMAAECCAFLEDANLEYERWRPYKRWARHLTPSDVVLTFNYDRVPDLLESEAPLLQVPDPCSLEYDDRTQRCSLRNPDRAAVLKLHGCVSWLNRGALHAPEITRGETPNPRAALSCTLDRLAIATPGPAKQASVDEKRGEGLRAKGLSRLWRCAEDAISRADAVAMIGYQMPPTDAFTRDWLVDRLRRRCVELGAQNKHLRIQSVLGPRVHDAPSERLAGLFQRLPFVHFENVPLYAEDFLTVVERDRL
jgi:hypothetical protein